MTGVLIASLVGAVVFFGVGLLFARRSELLASLAQGGVQSHEVGQGASQEMERMRASLIEAQSQHQGALSDGGAQLVDATTKLKSSQEEVARAKVDSTKAKAKVKNLQAEMATLTAKLEGLEAQAELSLNEVTSVQEEAENTRTGAAQLESQVDKLNLDADQAKIDIASLQSAVKKAKAEKAELQKRTTRAEKKLADASQEIHHAKAEGSKKNDAEFKALEARLSQNVESHNQSATEAKLFVAELEGQLQSATDRLEDSQKLTTTLRSEMEGMRGRVAEAGIRDQELTKLNEKVQAAERQQAEVSRLRKQNAELSALKLAASKPLEAKRTKREGKGTTQDALEIVIEEVAKNAKSNAVVLADRLGLPVVASGEHGYELAAYASLVSELANRTKTFVPVAHPDHVDFVDKNGTTITVWPFQAASENLSLVTLSTKNGAQGVASVRGAVADVADILNKETQTTN